MNRILIFVKNPGTMSEETKEGPENKAEMTFAGIYTALIMLFILYVLLFG